MRTKWKYQLIGTLIALLMLTVGVPHSTPAQAAAQLLKGTVKSVDAAQQKLRLTVDSNTEEIVRANGTTEYSGYDAFADIKADDDVTVEGDYEDIGTFLATKISTTKAIPTFSANGQDIPYPNGTNSAIVGTVCGDPLVRNVVLQGTLQAPEGKTIANIQLFLNGASIATYTAGSGAAPTNQTLSATRDLAEGPQSLALTASLRNASGDITPYASTPVPFPAKIKPPPCDGPPPPAWFSPGSIPTGNTGFPADWQQVIDRDFAAYRTGVRFDTEQILLVKLKLYRYHKCTGSRCSVPDEDKSQVTTEAAVAVPAGATVQLVQQPKYQRYFPTSDSGGKHTAISLSQLDIMSLQVIKDGVVLRTISNVLKNGVEAYTNSVYYACAPPHSLELNDVSLQSRQSWIEIKTP